MTSQSSMAMAEHAPDPCLSRAFGTYAHGLACRDLVAGYRAGPVLRGVSLGLVPGEIAALIGPNGSGKSTLLRCLAGELAPMAGEVTLDGLPLGRFPAKARARRIAVLPQRPVPPAVHGMSAADLVLLGRFAHMPWHGLASRQDRHAALAALEAVDALPLAGRDAAELSGGELQRIFLARALAQEADILLLDEPADALDPAHLAGLFSLLGEQARAGRAVLAVLHDVNAAALFCNRVLALKNGAPFFDCSPTELNPQRLSDLYDIPFHALPHPDPRFHGTLQFVLAPGASAGAAGVAANGR